SARGWYRNSAAMDEYNIATGDYVVFSRETTGVPGMSGVTRILEYRGYDSTYNLVQFMDLGTGGMISVTVINDGSYDVFDLNVGGYSFHCAVDVATGRISAIADGEGIPDGSEVMFHTAEGALTIEGILCPSPPDE
ncbi:hypothetical protein KY359_04435, partial [Candidatus Woesearchaeota archaeon]|nr:hypothetical protein [Candidatus Woesearchaeota archaeon]